MRNKNEKDSFQSASMLPPQSLEAEESVLGKILLDNQGLHLIRTIIEPDDFYRTAHRKIFIAMLELADQGAPIDLVMLTNYLRAKGELEEIGGAYYLSQLLDTPVVENAVCHAEIIKEKAVRRGIIERTNKLARAAFDNSTGLDELLTKVIEMSSEILKKAGKENQVSRLQLSAENLHGYFSSLRETPFQSLNNAIEGLMVSELTVVGGRPGIGKTSLVLEFLAHAAIDENSPVIYCGAQMTKQRIYARLLAQRCRISLRKILGGRVTDKNELEKLRRCHERINTAPIHDFIIKDRISVPSLQAMIMSAQSRIVKQDLGLLIIENLQQLFVPGRNFRNERDEASFIAELLKPFSYELKAPIIVSSQLNRDVDDRNEDKRPMPSDIFGKKAEELGDIIIFPFRPNYYEKKSIEEEGRPERNAELLISKGGPPIILPFTFWGDYLSWQENG